MYARAQKWNTTVLLFLRYVYIIIKVGATLSATDNKC